MTWTATNSEGFACPVALAVDVVVLTVTGRRLCVLGIRDDGRRRLPGGFVLAGEEPTGAAIRVLEDKAGLSSIYLEQLGAFAAPDRDPRGWIPSVAYLALVSPDTVLNDQQATWVSARGRQRWAYDHGDMISAALDRLDGKLWWSNVAVGILGDAFSLSDARAVYEAIAGTTYDAATFARDLKSTGLITPTGHSRTEGRGRPAALYRYTTNELAWGSGRRKRIADP